MKTTVDIEDGLLLEAKQRAVELRRPLRWLIEVALRAKLDALAGAERSEPPSIPWVTVDGGLPTDLDLSDRSAMGDRWMRERSRP